MLGSFKYVRPFYLKSIQHRFKLGYIVAVGPGYHQQMPFAPVFFQGPYP
jgi:hypothetical protein